MSAHQVTQPNKVFLDRDGQPLENGYIYIGTAGLNAVTNPITVYWDSALSVPATQPIRTSGGYPMRSGAIGTLYASATDYSMTVSDKNQSVVFSNLNRADILDAGSGGFTSSGTGAVRRTIYDKLSDFVSVKDFGAVGDGVTDDTVAVQAAIDYLAGVVPPVIGGTVYFPVGQYVLTAKITVRSFVRIKGEDWMTQPTNLNMDKMTSLYIDWGAGQDNHAIEMQALSAIDGFVIYYPDQVAKTEATPTAFGYSISTPTAGSSHDDINIKNIMLYNSYKGIRIENGARYHIENIHGNPLYIGIRVADCYDVSYIDLVHFWNFYTQSDTLETWVAANGTAFQFGRVDQLYASKLFGWNYSKCYDMGTALWANFTDIACDKARQPITCNNVASVTITGFYLIASPNSLPAVWIKGGGGTIRMCNGNISNTASTGVQVDVASAVLIENVNFLNKHSCVVSTETTTTIRLSNCVYTVPPFGSSNLKINDFSLPACDTEITLPAPTTDPDVIAGGYSFPLDAVAETFLQYDTTLISQRNSLYVLEFDYKLPVETATWYFKFIVQKDTGTNTQVSFAPQSALLLHDVASTAKKVRIPFFINHGRNIQLMTIAVNCTAGVTNAKLEVTNIKLYEQTNIKTSNAQVANMMQYGYNLDGYSMGQTLMAKGKNRIVITQSEAGIGRATEAPIDGAWIVGDECLIYEPTAGGFMGYVCTAAGTPGTWKTFGPITP